MAWRKSLDGRRDRPVGLSLYFGVRNPVQSTGTCAVPNFGGGSFVQHGAVASDNSQATDLVSFTKTALIWYKYSTLGPSQVLGTFTGDTTTTFLALGFLAVPLTT